ncbi:MAG: hypothetical protein R3E99_16805 [Burkholderiaceae bacterium]
MQTQIQNRATADRRPQTTPTSQTRAAEQVRPAYESSFFHDAGAGAIEYESWLRRLAAERPHDTH